jgi:hypothetical protein
VRIGVDHGGRGGKHRDGARNHVARGKGVACGGDHGGGVCWPWQWAFWAVPVIMTLSP